MRTVSAILAFAALSARVGIMHAQEQQGPVTPPRATATAPRTQDAATSPAPIPNAPAENLVVPPGTRMPLVLHNAVTTRNARPGDPVYLETPFPIPSTGRILIPAGTYVQAEIQETKRPGKVNDADESPMRLNSL